MVFSVCAVKYLNYNSKNQNKNRTKLSAYETNSCHKWVLSPLKSISAKRFSMWRKWSGKTWRGFEVQSEVWCFRCASEGHGGVAWQSRLSHCPLVMDLKLVHLACISFKEAKGAVLHTHTQLWENMDWHTCKIKHMLRKAKNNIILAKLIVYSRINHPHIFFVTHHGYSLHTLTVQSDQRNTRTK